MLTRRAFLVRTASAAIVLPQATERRERRMFVSLNGSLTLGKMPWPDFVRLAAAAGYGGADVNLGAAMEQGPDATRRLFADLGIGPGIVSLPVRFGADEAAYRDGLARLDEAARFAAAIECPRMMAVLPPSSATPKAEFRTIVKDRLVSIGEILRGREVRLGLEFLGPLHFRTRQPHEFIWRMTEALELAAECGENVGLTLDAWHWHHAGATAADIRAAGRSRIVHVHVSDARAQPAEEVRDNQRLFAGEGIIDLVAFFRALRAIGYDAAVSPEPIGRVPPGTPAAEGARLGLETTVKVMRSAGVPPRERR